MRIFRIRAFFVAALALAMLGTLGLAASAYAGEAPETAGSPPVGQEPAAAPAPAEAPPPPEEPKAETPPPEEPKAETPPPEEPKAETPPPEEPKAETPPPEEPKAETLPPPESMPGVTVLPGEGAPKGPHTGQGFEEVGLTATRSPLGGESAIAAASLARTGATEPPPSALLGLATSPPTAGGAAVQDSAAAEAAGARAAMSAAQRAGTLSCQLTGLGGKTRDNCAVGWLGGTRVMASSVTLTRSVSLLSVAATGLSGGGGGGHGGSAVENAPVSPTPGPAPGGASGAAVGGGAPGGGAVSIFLTLAGLLLLAGPRAMRRLRLSCEPWLTACFVLIPERPG
jgi:hypothetical protein